jgi:hypothetical protein
MRGFPSDAVLRMLEPPRQKSGGFFAFKNIFVSGLVFLKKLVGWKVTPLYRLQFWAKKIPPTSEGGRDSCGWGS